MQEGSDPVGGSEPAVLRARPAGDAPGRSCAAPQLDEVPNLVTVPMAREVAIVGPRQALAASHSHFSLQGTAASTS